MNHHSTPLRIPSVRSERVRGERNEKPESVLQGCWSQSRDGIAERPFTPRKSQRKNKFGPLVVTLRLHLRVQPVQETNLLPLILLIKTPYIPPSTALLNPSHTQPCNLGEEFSGCYFYWIPNNFAESLRLRCLRCSLVASGIQCQGGRQDGHSLFFFWFFLHCAGENTGQQSSHLWMAHCSPWARFTGSQGSTGH